MASTLEIATRAALQELLEKHAKESKFGFILSKESANELIDDVFILFQTSRNLKNAGDRLFSGAAKPKPSSLTPRSSR